MKRKFVFHVSFRYYNSPGSFCHHVISIIAHQVRRVKRKPAR